MPLAYRCHNCHGRVHVFSPGLALTCGCWVVWHVPGWRNVFRVPPCWAGDG